MRAWAIAAGFLVAVSGSARAENSACWGDDSREDISCTQISEKLILSLRGKSEADVQKAMKAKGREVPKGLHYISNYGSGEKSGSGDINFNFDGGRATVIFGVFDGNGGDNFGTFIWNAYAPPNFDKSTVDFTRPILCDDRGKWAGRC